MKIIQGHNRTQTNLFPISPDQSINPDNEVRITDLFVASTGSFQAAAALTLVTHSFKETGYLQ
jgi:hypothetical protein